MANGRGGGRGGNTRYNDRGNDRGNGQALALTEPRMTMPAAVPTVFGYDENAWRALTDAVYPSAKTPDAVMLALSYCKARKLDPFKRVVHIVPMWSSALNREVETVWPGIGEMRTTASRTGVWAGNDDCLFGRTIRRGFYGKKSGEGRNGGQPWSTEAKCPEMDFPEWAQFTVYKIVGGVRCPFVGPKVRFTEIFSGQKGMRVPNERWQQAPWQMLEKCAEAAALRRAFPDELGDSWSSDEMDGKELRGMSTEQARYHVADAEGVQEAQQDRGGETDVEVVDEGNPNGARDDRDSDDDSADDDQNGWDSRELERYVKSAINFLQNVGALEHLESAIANEAETTANLPDKERVKVENAQQDARQRLSPKADEAKAAADTKPADEMAQTDAGQSEQQQDPDRVPDEPPYVRNLRLRVDEVEIIGDLIALESAEKRAIDNQPAWAARICQTMFDEKRAALKS